jgi:cell division septation protein DedD
MRFEIRTGGTLLILAGLAVLSGSVFALGLVAGYEMSRQNQVDQNQLASVYQAPSPIAMPTVEAPPPPLAAIPASSPIAPANPATHKPKHISEDALAPPPDESEPPPPPGEENPNENAAENPAGNPAENPAENPAAAASPAAEASTGGVAIASAPAPDNAAAAAAAQAKRRAFNIQIDAVMDHSGAEEMADRLRRLGYQPTIVQTNIAGQTWYRLRVGPYATADDARAAQNKLRQQYKTAFGSD